MDIQGTAGNDRLTGTGEADLIEGLTGDDTLRPSTSGLGIDTLDGGLGNDTYVLTGAVNIENVYLDLSYEIRDDSGFDTIQFGAREVWDLQFDWLDEDTLIVTDRSLRGTQSIRIDLSGGSIERFITLDGRTVVPGDTFDGSGNPEAFRGTDGNDKINGGGGNDTLRGNGGADYLYGGAGADLLEGGGGEDYFVISEGDDTIDGGAGIDVLDAGFIDGAPPVQYDLLAGTPLRPGLAVRNVERLTMGGSRFDDALAGGNYADTLFGGFGGADTLIGRDGDDVLIAQGPGSLIDGGDGDDLINAGIGGEGTTILGGAGQDQLVILDGTINTSSNRERGGDIYDFSELFTTGTLVNGATVQDVEGILLVLEAIDRDGLRVDVMGTDGDDRVEAGRAADIIFGANGDDELFGRFSDDILHGEGGHDLLVGGTGADLLQGGAGDDVLYGDFDDGLI